MTMLEKLREQGFKLHEQMNSGKLPLQLVFVLQEINYRVEVMENCRMIVANAPESTDIKVLSAHFRLVDAFFHFAANDRKLGMPFGSEDEQKKVFLDRKTAEDNLNNVIADAKKRMQSFRPDSPATYSAAIGKIGQTVLIAWIQHRNCYVDITKFEEAIK